MENKNYICYTITHEKDNTFNVKAVKDNYDVKLSYNTINEKGNIYLKYTIEGKDEYKNKVIKELLESNKLFNEPPSLNINNTF